VTIKGKKSPDLIVEQDINMRLNADRVQIRDFRLPINFEGNLALTLELSKRGYFVDECIVGRIQMVRGKPKPKEISVSLIQQELYNLNPESDNGLRLYHEITFLSLNNDIPKDEELNWIPFKIPLSNFNLPPTFSFHPTKDKKVMFVSSYQLKINCTQGDGKAWHVLTNVVLWREKAI
jgi:hypothetical protein